MKYTNLEYTDIKTPYGQWNLVAKDNEIVAFGKKLPLKIWEAKRNDENATLRSAAFELTEYFAGQRKDFSFKIGFAWGTDFQKKVWTTLLKIPYGKTWSYRTQAEKLRNEKAYRAVGAANGKNPLCVIVPCHRVVAADGGLGGYSGGLEVKKALLALEASHQ